MKKVNFFYIIFFIQCLNLSAVLLNKTTFISKDGQRITIYSDIHPRNEKYQEISLRHAEALYQKIERHRSSITIIEATDLNNQLFTEFNLNARLFAGLDKIKSWISRDKKTYAKFQTLSIIAQRIYGHTNTICADPRVGMSLMLTLANYSQGISYNRVKPIIKKRLPKISLFFDKFQHLFDCTIKITNELILSFERYDLDCTEIKHKLNELRETLIKDKELWSIQKLNEELSNIVSEVYNTNCCLEWLKLIFKPKESAFNLISDRSKYFDEVVFYFVILLKSTELLEFFIINEILSNIDNDIIIGVGLQHAIRLEEMLIKLGYNYVGGIYPLQELNEGIKITDRILSDEFDEEYDQRASVSLVQADEWLATQINSIGKEVDEFYKKYILTTEQIIS